jgi:hypothetical protein
MRTIDDYKITPATLIAAGYREYPGSNLLNHADRHFQKTIKSKDFFSGKKLYFINVYVYNQKQINGNEVSYGATANVQFYRGDESKHDAFSVDFLIDIYHDVAAMESFYQTLFWAMPGTVPDVHNND